MKLTDKQKELVEQLCHADLSVESIITIYELQIEYAGWRVASENFLWEEEDKHLEKIKSLKQKLGFEKETPRALNIVSHIPFYNTDVLTNAMRDSIKESFKSNKIPGKEMTETEAKERANKVRTYRVSPFLKRLLLARQIIVDDKIMEMKDGQ